MSAPKAATLSELKSATLCWRGSSRLSVGADGGDPVGNEVDDSVGAEFGSVAAAEVGAEDGAVAAADVGDFLSALKAAIVSAMK